MKGRGKRREETEEIRRDEGNEKRKMKGDNRGKEERGGKLKEGKGRKKTGIGEATMKTWLLWFYPT